METWGLKGTQDTAPPAGRRQKPQRGGPAEGSGAAASREARGGRWRPSVRQSNQAWGLPEPRSPHASQASCPRRPPVIPGTLNVVGLFPTLSQLQTAPSGLSLLQPQSVQRRKGRCPGNGGQGAQAPFRPPNAQGAPNGWGSKHGQPACSCICERHPTQPPAAPSRVSAEEQEEPDEPPAHTALIVPLPDPPWRLPNQLLLLMGQTSQPRPAGTPDPSYHRRPCPAAAQDKDRRPQTPGLRALALLAGGPETATARHTAPAGAVSCQSSALRPGLPPCSDCAGPLPGHTPRTSSREAEGNKPPTRGHAALPLHQVRLLTH